MSPQGNFDRAENLMSALDSIRDSVFAAKDEVGRRGELTNHTWQAIGDSYTALFFLMKNQHRRIGARP